MELPQIVQSTLSMASGLGTFLGGSAMGVIIKIFYDKWQERVQTLTYELESELVFTSEKTDKLLQATLVVKRDGKEIKFSNLSIVTVSIKNTTRTDYSSFEFGVTIPDGHNIVRAEFLSKGRLHSLTSEKNPSPIEQANQMDLVCKPFNRNDTYSAKLFIHSINEPLRKSEVTVETAASVNLAPAKDRDGFDWHSLLLSRTGELIFIPMMAVLFMCASSVLFPAVRNSAAKEVKSLLEQESLGNRLNRLEEELTKLSAKNITQE